MDAKEVLAKWQSLEQVVISLQHAIANSEEGNEALRVAFIETRAALEAEVAAHEATKAALARIMLDYDKMSVRAFAAESRLAWAEGDK